MLDIVEMFTTLSGEAPIPGVPVFLVRFSECNLDCLYCDTGYKEEKNYSINETELIKKIKKKASEYPGIRILFTGGEPLLDPRGESLFRIMERLPEYSFYIETNGTIKINNFSLANCHFVLDWKTVSSGVTTSFCVENLHHLNPGRDCIKFVINRNDFDEIREKISVIRKLNPGLPVYISPQHNSLELKELAEFILQNKISAALSVQLHKYIWGPRTRGV